jgi:hypothetical protein
LLAACPCGRFAAAGRQANRELRENMTLTRTAADELWSTGRGRGLGSKSRAGGHPRAPPEAADDASRPQSWSWNGLANCEACEAQAVAPLAGQFVLPHGTVQFGERYHHTPAWLRDGWVGTRDWQVPAAVVSPPHCPAAYISRAVTLCDSVRH